MKRKQTKTPVAWFAGWYAERLHAVVGPVPPDRARPFKAVCGYWASWANAESGNRRLERGPAKCKHCMRMVDKINGESATEVPK